MSKAAITPAVASAPHRVACCDELESSDRGAARIIVGRPEEIPTQHASTVVTVGTFDGVHKGHRRLLDAATAQARRIGAQAVALTWDQHPRSVLAASNPPQPICGFDRKLELLADAGVDLVVVLRLHPGFMNWEPEEFVRRILTSALRARAVVVGSDWRFGRRAAGTVAMLSGLGISHGFDVITIERAGAVAEPASSTKIRAALAQGDIHLAARLLGRRPELDLEPFDGDDGIVVCTSAIASSLKPDWYWGCLKGRETSGTPCAVEVTATGYVRVYGCLPRTLADEPRLRLHLLDKLAPTELSTRGRRPPVGTLNELAQS